MTPGRSDSQRDPPVGAGGVSQFRTAGDASMAGEVEFPSVPAEYEVQELVGRGGMGEVYRARHRALGRDVAIKVLPPPSAEEDSALCLARFRQEARTLAQLSHPGIVSVFDAGWTANGRSYFVMEYVDGRDLAQVLRSSGKMAPELVLSVIGQLCAALDHAHVRGVIHRDVKPGNILVGGDGRIRVADFGLARTEDLAAAHALTASNTALGTADYAAPEILVPGGVPDRRADVYSVGVVLYQLLTGEVPRGLFKLPSQRVPGLDPRFDSVVCRAMEPEPADRYAGLRELDVDLDLIRAGAADAPGSAVSGRPARFSAPPSPTKETGGAGTPSDTKSGAHRRPLALRWGVAAALAVLVFLAFRWKPIDSGLTSEESVVAAGATSATAPEPDPAAPDWLPVVDPEAGWQSMVAGLPSRPIGVTAEWRRVGGELRTTLATVKGHQTLEFPDLELPPNFDIRVRLTRHDGVGAVMVAFRHGAAGAFVMFDSYTGDRQFFEATFGSVAGPLEGSIRRKDGMFLPTGARHEILIQVRDDWVRAEVDGREFLKYRPEWSGLGQREGWFFPAPLAGRQIFGVGVCCSDTTFHSFDWRPAGEGGD